MYLEIIKVWYQMFTRLERRRHPLGPYVIGEGFIESVANASVDSIHVAAACARVVYLPTTGDRDSWPVEFQPQEAHDPTTAWWCAIHEPDRLGVHHFELGGGTLEFLSVGFIDEPPNLKGFRPDWDWD
jgi:hypothetical protein